MIHIARTWRGFAGCMAAGFVGVTLIASGTASADPLYPQPPSPAPAPAQAAVPPVQNLNASPGSITNRFAPVPAQVPAPMQVPAATPAPVPAAIPATGQMPAAGQVPAAGQLPVAAPVAPAITPAVTGTVRDYLNGKGVKLEAQRPQGFNALEITLPMPPRWTSVPDPNVPDAFAVIADRVGGNSVYTSNAQVVVYKLVGDLDPAEAISHGFVDSQNLLAWRTTNASMAEFGGFPSSVIEGTYRENDMTLNTSRRHVIATSGSENYLVSLSVTTAQSQAVADAPATDAIINGFRVATPTTAGHTPARAGAPAAVAPQTPARAASPAAPAQAPVSIPHHPAAATAPAQAPAPNLTPALQAVPGQVAAAPPVAAAPAPSR
ncbi:LpqN/LpqT family lipoprotein [Mycobacterium marinum]|uniref:LpqN/LpqT family lipoprotein n=1 Tax=Mycobacterium marinum TaxID=1781 RepID=UPI002358A6D2|nr:LpqN/LpqT family lipoprotein [Mycobacterium marinum]MDC9006694.1 LpqN/LpqT family lipoprotein [Mycobacterium marinum]